ncbi:hypothetical protein [Salipiger bermudensis]|uniref:hypothetical protein n=1 Tax=Salipiger bermudensis TaxID=344736 RepID=UPI001A908AE0|nr:hypothetical protein [Salipiger bermudensis]MBN9675061.1 hypothetical protein [Salipiger bermudensis]
MTGQTLLQIPAPWHATVAPGDIVAFRFPHETDEADGSELPKVRPTLVIDVVERFGERYAVLAYGTTNPRRFGRREAYAIDVLDEAERDGASLHRQTRFHASRRLMVSLKNSGFDIRRDACTARLGRLSGDSLKRLQQVRARIHAEQDMRRDRNRQRRAARPVVIETRRKGRIRSEKEVRHV